MKEFKVGDRVIALIDTDFLTKGKEYEVVCADRGSIKLMCNSGSVWWFDASVFELAPTTQPDEFQLLLDQANAGLEALCQLYSRRDEIGAMDTRDGRIRGEQSIVGVIHNEYDYSKDRCLLVKKKARALKPMAVAGYNVTLLAGDIVKIGCTEIHLDKALEVLDTLMLTILGVKHGYTSCRAGIADGKGNILSWADADRLYAALKELK